MPTTAHWLIINGQTELLDADDVTKQTDTVLVLETNHVLVRTLFWYDVRMFVPEDYTGNPRTPQPYTAKIFIRDGDGTAPDPPASDHQILTTMMGVQGTPVVGSRNPSDELTYRVWCGTSGAQPVESKAARRGDLFAFTGEMFIAFDPNRGFSSPDGLWQFCTAVVFWTIATLVEYH